MQSLNQKLKTEIEVVNTLLLTKISTAGKVHLVYLLANIAKFKNRKEVFLKTTFFKIQRSLSLGCYYVRRHFRYQ